MESIKRINRQVLDEAKAASARGSVGGSASISAGVHMSADYSRYMVAALVALAVYFVLYYAEPDFVMKTGDSGKKEFDYTKGVLMALGAGLVVVALYMLK